MQKRHDNEQHALEHTSRTLTFALIGHELSKQWRIFSATRSAKNRDNTSSIDKLLLAQFATFLLDELADAHGQLAAQTIHIMFVIDGRHDLLQPDCKGLAGFCPRSPWQRQALLVPDP